MTGMDEYGDYQYGKGGPDGIQGRSHIMSYAIGGILEHFEDEYDSEDDDDIEIDEYPRYGDDSNMYPSRGGTALSHLSDRSEGYKGDKHTPAYQKLALKAMQKGIPTSRPN